MARDVHGNLVIQNGNIRIEGDEHIHSDVITSLSSFNVKGSATWFNWDGNTTHVLHNAGTGGTSSTARFMVGNFNVPANENYGQFSYFDSSYISDSGGLNYQNSVVIKSNNGAAGLVLTAESGTMSFMMNANSDPKMVFTQAGSLGINSLIPGEKLEVGGNILLSNGSDRQLYVGDNPSGNGYDLTLSSGASSLTNGTAGDMFINGGDATAGGVAVGGDVFISAGNNGASGFEQVFIGGNKTNTSSNYTLSVTSNSSGNGAVGIRTDNPQTILHIQRNAITTPTIDNSTVLLMENSTSFSGEVGISMLSGTNGKSHINFGDSSGERRTYLTGVTNGLEIGSSAGDTALFISNTSEPKVTVGTSSTAEATLHVIKSYGSTPTFGSETMAIFQNNFTTNSSSAICILSGAVSDSRIYFGDANDDNVGRIEYNHINNDIQFTTNGVTDNGPRINRFGNLITKGQSVSTYYENITFGGIVNLAVDAHLIVATGNNARGQSRTYNLPDSGDGVEDGHVIEVRTLGLTNTAVTLQASTGTPNGFFRLDGTTPVTYPLTQNTSYRFIYDSTANRWIQLR